MNTANLQLQGMLGSIAALMDALKQKGVLSQQDISEALDDAEAAAAGREADELSPANREAILFPIRYLQHVNAGAESSVAFDDVARAIGGNDRP